MIKETGAVAHRKLVNFRLPPILIARMRKRAERLGVTCTAVVEAALRAYLKEGRLKRSNRSSKSTKS